mmetsp:Transcript_5755/g.21775  ORF Transcript_5755/g.21775 Transcript_5755/m.21775 type:complete len:550 (-) Transcript_5755:2552-4201(-)|eukprot:CAMPEP_0117438982 /NCGR_PEP_ID=MMETSP0759-20121206/2335_1 /TAXON_ID=63605 /ORGANISM="Percolomonas cosmopolitus, Strain WS" /LENGTH=549 /DNA_ID=CAMNT_0005230693 /DNA_START=90 /DNA_END=1739 /DNA_ORIENTATION=-
MTPLEIILREFNVHLTTSDKVQRDNVKNHLRDLARAFVASVYLPQGNIEYDAYIVDIGSHRLGVDMPDSDLDLICMVPPDVTIEDFFDKFPGILESDTQANNILVIRSAHVPLIKFTMFDVDVELLFASCPLHLSISQLQNHADIDTVSRRSLDAIATDDAILRIVEDNVHIDTFRKLVRCMKKWAKERGIYKQSVGLPGGIGWTIMCARICQMYPHASLNELVRKMFETYSQWSWNDPVHLEEECHIRTATQSVMTVLTPGRVTITNCTKKISRMTLQTLMKELRRAERISQTAVTKEDWKQLFAPYQDEFFAQFRKFFEISVTSASSLSVESRMTTFTKNLEETSGIEFRLLPKWFPDRATAAHSVIYIGVSSSSSCPKWAEIMDDCTKELIKVLPPSLRLNETDEREARCKVALKSRSQMSYYINQESNTSYQDRNALKLYRGANLSTERTTTHRQGGLLYNEEEGIKWENVGMAVGAVALFGVGLTFLAVAGAAVGGGQNEARRMEEKRRQKRKKLWKQVPGFIIVCLLALFIIVLIVLTTMGSR